MTSSDRQCIVSNFVNGYITKEVVSETDPEFESILALDRFAHEVPEIAWELILEILGVSQDSKVIKMLAAGPLEDLIEYHGAEFIDRIEDNARRDPLFRHLLGGVWESSTPEVWIRIEAARGKPW